MSRSPISLLISACAILLGGSAPFASAQPSTTASEFEAIVKPYLEQHCASCHGPKTAKAGYRIDHLKPDFTLANMAEEWKEVLDRVNAGEMPPKASKRPDAKATEAFVTWTNNQLREVERTAKGAGGRIPMRRLNRDEYANTIRDLLQLDVNIVRPLVEEMPSDGKAEGFDRLGVALFFDQTQIERSLDVAEKIASNAIVGEPPKPNKILNRFAFQHLRPPAEMVEAYPSATHKIPRGAQDRVVKPDVIEVLQGGPTYRRETDGWGHIEHFLVKDVVTRDGYFRIRIKAKVENRSRTEKNKFYLQYGMNSPIQVEQEVELDPSGVTEAVMFLRGPVNGEVKGPQVFRVLWNHTEKAVIREPKYNKAFFEKVGLANQLERAVTRRAPQAERDALRKKLDEATAVMDAWKGPANIFNPEMDIEKLPRLIIESIEIEGPVQKEWPPASHKKLLFAGNDRQDMEYVREIFARFLPRAYRRPVTKQEVEAIVAVVQNARDAGKLPFLDAMRVGLQRVLTAPGFVFLQEPAAIATPRPLTDHELASRLSYFLWSTMPDEELANLANAGKLRDPSVVKSQVRRMLADPKAEQFVRNFAGQWLAVRDYGSVQPAAEYRDYDKPLEQAARQEPLAFFAEVVAKNLPITSFLDSDFLVINERLAKHYGIDGVTGPEFRQVRIEPKHHRGGVLGMAGLMTFLADGTRTLPMRRGTWVLKELLNDPPNDPPPNAGEIQPNTAGKNLTVRQRLELHRNNDVCASCHAKLDPYGLALENYDAIGKWRERFNGEGFRGSNGPVLDVSGSLADGSKFTTLEEYKAGLMKQKDRFARAFSTKLLTYALGRPVGFADREMVEGLVSTLKSNDYRMQSLLDAIVTSEPFQTK